MIYVAIFLILACLSTLDLVTTSRHIRMSAVAFIFIFLVIIAGIRWETGPDWGSYYSYFVDYENYRDGVYINLIEPGYMVLNGLIKYFTDNYTYFLFFIAIITIGLKFSIFVKHSKIALLVILFYYCYYLADITAVRQFTSLSITLLAGVFIVKRRPILFIICIIAATSIHVSAIAFSGAYWIYHKKISNRTLAIILVISFAFGFLNVAGFLIQKVIGLLGPASMYADKLTNYNDQGADSGAGNPYISFILGAIKRAVIIPVLFYYKGKINPEDSDRYRGYLNLLVVGNVIYFLFIISFPVVTRLSVSYLYYEIFLLSYILVSIKDWSLKFVVFLLLVLFGAFRLYSTMAPYMDLYVPYKTFFNY